MTAEEVDQRLGTKHGYAREKSGAKIRYYARPDETASAMGAKAAEQALEKAGLGPRDIDLIVCASSTPEQVIPCTSVLVQNELGIGDSGIPCFDVNATCLSFLVAFENVSYMLGAQGYQRALLISTEVASVGINWSQKESAVLFGDGAAAAIIERTPTGESSAICNSLINTYGNMFEYVTYVGGGTKMKIDRESNIHDEKRWGFNMAGHQLMKFALKKLPGFIDSLLGPMTMTLSDVDLIVPHQASGLALKVMKRHLKIRDDQWFSNIEERGNMVAASIPMALHESIEEGRLKRGDRAMLIGTGAGVSMGGIVVDY